MGHDGREINKIANILFMFIYLSYPEEQVLLTKTRFKERCRQEAAKAAATAAVVVTAATQVNASMALGTAASEDSNDSSSSGGMTSSVSTLPYSGSSVTTDGNEHNSSTLHDVDVRRPLDATLAQSLLQTSSQVTGDHADVSNVVGAVIPPVTQSSFPPPYATSKRGSPRNSALIAATDVPLQTPPNARHEDYRDAGDELSSVHGGRRLRDDGLQPQHDLQHSPQGPQQHAPEVGGHSQQLPQQHGPEVASQGVVDVRQNGPSSSASLPREDLGAGRHDDESVASLMLLSNSAPAAIPTSSSNAIPARNEQGAKALSLMVFIFSLSHRYIGLDRVKYTYTMAASSYIYDRLHCLVQYRSLHIHWLVHIIIIFGSPVLLATAVTK